MQLDLDTILDIIKVGVGIAYLYLEYKAKPQMWIASVVMPCIGMWLFYNKGLYADCAMNVYYLAIAVYGYYRWTHHGSAEKASGRPITHVPARTAALLVPAWLAVWAAVAWVLATFTDSTVVMLDSMTASMSIIGMWMLAQKYAEEWLVWIVVDAIYVYLYYYKGIYFSGTLYICYTATAIFGYRRWAREAEQRPGGR